MTAPVPPPRPKTSAVTILLTEVQTTSLDQVSINIVRKTGARLSRSAIVRALSRAALEFHKHWQECKSEEDLYEIFASLLEGSRQ